MKEIKKFSEILWKKAWFQFLGRTLFYFLIMLVMIYLYHYKNVGGETFIYNEF